MIVKVANSRFISFSSLKFGALYQHLLRHISDFQKLGERLIQEANRAKAFRYTDRIEELGIVLSNIPIKEYKLIGQYYVGWAAYLEGERSGDVFEKVLEQSHRYKAKALISLAVLEAHRGNYASELAYYNEALKYADNPSTKIDVLRAIATVKAKEGFNKQSLRDLEQMWPSVRYGDLRVYHDYLNSLAVELGEAGRIREAQNICKITLASPYVIAYPEWRETSNEIALKAYKSRSVVSSPKPVLENVTPLPVAESRPSTIQENPARVFSYADWKEKKEKMVKEANGGHTEETEDVNKMTEKELLVEIIQLASDKEVGEEDLRKILTYARKVVYSPKKN